MVVGGGEVVDDVDVDGGGGVGDVGGVAVVVGGEDGGGSRGDRDCGGDEVGVGVGGKRGMRLSGGVMLPRARL